ncbi:unnamed protein product [Porites evermanni]|uniref:MADF domain-containing protein n=1 Tax=Porites evermanni TaxID=104178 RepID=A0ABN8R2W1_9CNID|nr:unnamed protein product [Porites evermanni]
MPDNSFTPFFQDSIKMAEAEMKRKLFIWKKQHELCLLKEVTCVEPYAKKQSDRGAAWRTIASNLNGNKQEGFKVTERSCRDRFKRIMEEFENKEQVEKKASGIDAEYDELDQLCQDIKERMEEVSSQEEAESAKKKLESEKAASMRQMAMETSTEFSGTKGVRALKLNTDTTSELLKPKIVEDVPGKLFGRTQLQAKYYNISAKEIPPLSNG